MLILSLDSFVIIFVRGKKRLNNKYILSIAFALLLFITPNISLNLAHAEEELDNTEDATEEQDQDIESEEEEEEVEVIESLSLEEAIEYNKESNFSLLKLENNLENVKSQLAGTEDDYRDLRFDIRDLERDMDRLRKYGSATFQERYQIQEMLKDLEDVKEQLEEGIEGLKTSEKVTQYMNEQLDVSLPSQVTSSFIQLIMQEEQINLLNENLESEYIQLDDLKRSYNFGVTSRSEYNKALREVVQIESDIQQATDKLQNDLMGFCLDIGVVCDEDLTLTTPQFGQLQLVTQEIDTNELIEDSYSMKIAEEELELERYLREQVYDDEDANKFDREQADLAVELKLIEIDELKRDAEKSIHELYTNIQDQYYNIEDATRDIKYLKEDIAEMKTRYDIGVVSKQEYELFSRQVTQAEIAKKLDEYQYQLLLEQVELIESGIILVD